MINVFFCRRYDSFSIQTHTMVMCLSSMLKDEGSNLKDEEW